MARNDDRVLHYQFIPVPYCDMCGSSRHKLLGVRLNRSHGLWPRRISGIGVTVKKCRDCGLIYSDPRAKPQDLSDHYGIPPESYWRNPECFELTDSYFEREIHAAKRLLEFRPGMTALDIGAGLGKAMIAMERAGFDAYGIEPSPQFRDKAIEGMGVRPERIQLAGVEDAEFTPESFDFVSFGAVLEHIQEPANALERAMRWLKPAGILQAEVPSSRYFMSSLLNLYNRMQGLNYVTNISPMHPPFHLYEFGLQSFHEHGKRTGYAVAEHFYSVCAIYHLPRLLHAPVRAFMKATDTGMQLTVYLRKSHPAGHAAVSNGA